MPNIEHQRWNTALSRVAKVERKSRKLRSRFFPRTFTYSKRSAWATEEGFDALPRDQQHELPGHGKTIARVRAESILIGKFDVEKEIRLRAFYPAKNLSVRYQTGGKRNSITRTVDAYNKVRPYAPELMPTIYDHGTIRNHAGAYLVRTPLFEKSHLVLSSNL